jgi:hypothetical protein
VGVGGTFGRSAEGVAAASFTVVGTDINIQNGKEWGAEKRVAELEEMIRRWALSHGILHNSSF